MGTGHPHRAGPRHRGCSAGDLPALDGAARARSRAREAQPAVRMAHNRGRDRGHRGRPAVRSIRRGRGLHVRPPGYWSRSSGSSGDIWSALTIRKQIASLVPAAHVAIWVAAAYLLIAAAISGHELVALAVGMLAAVCAGVVVLRLAHRSLLAELVYMTKRIMGRGSPRQDSPRATPPLAR